VSGICEYHPDYLKITKNSENRVIQFGHYSITSCLVISGRNKSINKEALHSKLTETISEALEGTQFSILNTKNFHVNLYDSSPAPSESSEVKPMELEGEKHEYSTEIVPADFTEESFEVYKEYQINVHHDSPSSLSKSGYSNFLCGKNIIQEKPSENHPLGLGNFHQLHRIDGKLVAVGVLDFLPSGVSSVYFFYSPKYQHLSMGVFSALKEIELIQQNKSETFKYYYMGFYIDTCQKMRYKGEYLPSQLLCPKNYVWVDIEKCLEMKAAHRFIELHQCSPQTAGTQDDDMNWQGIDFLKFLKDHLKVEYQGNIMKFESFNSNGQNFIIKLMMEAQNFLSKWMVQRLVFKLG
jgi:arginyl-tRNA--protein-N-Asp/Glu arginylyltransferase